MADGPTAEKNQALCTKKEALWYNSSVCCRHSGCETLCSHFLYPYPYPSVTFFCSVPSSSSKNYTRLVGTQCIRLSIESLTMCTEEGTPVQHVAREKRLPCTHTLELWAKICLLWVRLIIERPSSCTEKKEIRGKRRVQGIAGDRLPWKRGGPDIGFPSGPGQLVVTTTRLGGHRGSSIRETALKSHMTEVNEAVFSLLISFNLP